MELMKKKVWRMVIGILLCIIMVMLVEQDTETILAASPGYKTCSDCNGTGKIICTKCNGNGCILEEKEVSAIDYTSTNGKAEGVDVVYDTAYVSYNSINGVQYACIYWKSKIVYKPCSNCGGTSEDAGYSRKNIYYSDTNFKNTTCIWTTKSGMYSSYVTYVEGSGYTGSCTTCAGSGEIPITYQISYHGNGHTGGSMSNSTHTYNVSQNLNANQFTRTGYTFLGWSTTDGVTTDTGTDITISYQAGASVKNLALEQGKVVNLYAIWKRNQYVVTYDANGGTFIDTITEQQVYYGDSVDLSPTCTKDGYIFLGWATAKEDTICQSSYTMPAEDITLYALYSIPVSDIKEAYIVSYNTENTSNYNLFQLKEQSETVNGYLYALDGINLLEGLKTEHLEVWLLLYDNAGNRSQIPIETPISSETQNPENIPVPVLYLQTVEHYLWNMQTESYQYYMSISELIYEGQTYTPSYILEDAADYPKGYEPESIDGSYTVCEMTTTKAYYKPIAYTLYFDANGGECDTKQKSVYTGDIYGEMPTPSKKGYDFMGWYTDKIAGIKVTATDIYTEVKDSTLYAIWVTKLLQKN